MHLNELSKKLADKLIVRFMLFRTDWSFVVEREKKEEMNGRIACTFFSRKRQKLGGEVESFAFEYLGGLSGLLCTTPTVNIVEYRVVSGSRLCKLGVFFHAPAEPSSLFFTHTFSLRLEKFCDADNHIFVACGIKVKSWIRKNFSILEGTFNPLSI